jgi:glycine/D-amino acid oxidase-like deaminating enzyme
MSRPEPLQRIAIVGAGIFGVTAALELHRRGHAVELFDPGPLPHPLAASTDVTKMIRMDYGADAFYTELMEEAFPGWDAWNAEWGQALYHETGFLLLAGAPLRAGAFQPGRRDGIPTATSIRARDGWRADAWWRHW